MILFDQRLLMEAHFGRGPELGGSARSKASASAPSPPPANPLWEGFDGLEFGLDGPPVGDGGEFRFGLATPISGLARMESAIRFRSRSTSTIVT